jgi:hypothetical protein
MIWLIIILFLKDLTFISFFFFFLNHADEIDVSVHSLDDQLEEFTDKEISDFVSFDSSYTCLWTISLLFDS